jgi:hypothetical protein
VVRLPHRDRAWRWCRWLLEVEEEGSGVQGQNGGGSWGKMGKRSDVSAFIVAEARVEGWRRSSTSV